MRILLALLLIAILGLASLKDPFKEENDDIPGS